MPWRRPADAHCAADREDLGEPEAAEYVPLPNRAARRRRCQRTGAVVIAPLSSRMTMATALPPLDLDVAVSRTSPFCRCPGLCAILHHGAGRTGASGHDYFTNIAMNLNAG
jgi:hypothetical protein